MSPNEIVTAVLVVLGLVLNGVGLILNAYGARKVHLLNQEEAKREAAEARRNIEAGERQEQFDMMRENLEGLKGLLESTTAHVDFLRDTLIAQNDRIRVLEKQNHTLTDTLDQREQELRLIKSANDSMRDRLAAFEKENEQLKEEREELRECITRLEAKLIELGNKLAGEET